MSFSLSVSTNVGKVRYLINDIDSVNYVLTDEAINVFISLRGGDLFLAASQSMLAIASSQALLAKMKKAGPYSEDLKSVAAECRAAAQMFEEMAYNVPAEAQAEIFWTDFSMRDTLRNKTMRGEVF